jgi:hypothetical protein
VLVASEHSRKFIKSALQNKIKTLYLAANLAALGVFIIMVVFILVDRNPFFVDDPWYTAVTAAIYFVISIFLLGVVGQVICIIKTECEADMHKEMYVLTVFIVGYTLSYLLRSFAICGGAHYVEL